MTASSSSSRRAGLFRISGGVRTLPMSCISAGDAELAEQRAVDPEAARLHHRQDRDVHHVRERVVVHGAHGGERQQRVAVLADGLRQFVHDVPHLGRLRHAVARRVLPHGPHRRRRLRVELADGRHVGQRSSACAARCGRGRCGRAGRSGNAMSFGSPADWSRRQSASTVATSSSTVTPLSIDTRSTPRDLSLPNSSPSVAAPRDHRTSPPRPRRRRARWRRRASPRAGGWTTSVNGGDVARDERVAGRVELRRRAARRAKAPEQPIFRTPATLGRPATARPRSGLSGLVPSTLPPTSQSTGRRTSRSRPLRAAPPARPAA